MKPQLTTHIQVDVPDEAVGTIQRYIAGIKGVSNFVTQPNGTERRKGEKPTKMNGATKRDVILAVLRERGGHVPLALIAEAVKEAGLASEGLGSYMSDLVEARLINRIERGVYSLTKALPPPKKAVKHA